MVEPAQAQHGLAVAGNRATHEAGVAALGDDAHSEAVAKGEHPCDFGGVRGTDHHQGWAAEAPRPVGLVGGLEVGVLQAVRRPYDLAHGGQEAPGHLERVSHVRIFSRRERPAH